MLSRRAALAALAAAAATAVAACTRPPSGATPTRAGPSLAVTGPREEVLPVGRFGMLNFPDGHLSYQQVGDRRRMWFASGLPAGSGRTVALDTDDLVRFAPAARDADGDAVAGLVPVGGTDAFDSDYSGPGSVFPGSDGSTLWLVYHGENHTFEGVTYDLVPFFQTIGLARSDDGGRSWQRLGIVLAGQVPRDDGPAPREATGAGTPCVLVADGFAYVFYVDLTLSGPDEIHVARVPLAEVDTPTAWRKWVGGGFDGRGDGGPSTPVVGRPGDGERSIYSAYPSVSWSTALDRYLMVFESRDGYWWTHSADLVTWEPAQRLLDSDGPEIGGVAFVSYPSLLSPGASSDQVTGTDAYLYLGLAEEEGTSHSLWRIPVAVTP